MRNIVHPADQQAIKVRIALLKPEQQALWGKMNVNQMVVHLSDQLRCAKGDIKTKPVGGFMHRTLVRWLVLAGMKPPKGKVKTAQEFDQEKDGTKPVAFTQDRDALVALLDWFLQAPEAFNWQQHPAFGAMNKRQWGRLAYTHLDHHLSQFGV